MSTLANTSTFKEIVFKMKFTSQTIERGARKARSDSSKTSKSREEREKHAALAERYTDVHVKLNTALLELKRISRSARATTDIRQSMNTVDAAIEAMDVEQIGAAVGQLLNLLAYF